MIIKREYGGRSRIPLKTVLDRAIDLMGKDKALSWWIKPLEYFDNQSPYQLCKGTKSSQVMRWLDTIDMS